MKKNIILIFILAAHTVALYGSCLESFSDFQRSLDGTLQLGDGIGCCIAASVCNGSAGGCFITSSLLLCGVCGANPPAYILGSIYMASALTGLTCGATCCIVGAMGRCTNKDTIQENLLHR